VKLVEFRIPMAWEEFSGGFESTSNFNIADIMEE